MFKYPQKISEFDSINKSYRNTRNRKWKLNKLMKLLISPQIIAHLASIVALASVYFSVRNWQWSYTQAGDWIVPIACLILFFIGFKVLYRREINILVTYEELHDLLTVARYEAESSIVNIGGDISWLKHDIDSLRKIKSEHKSLRIIIYYDKNKLSEETKILIETLRKENIVNLIPYPEGITPPNIRCMVTDYDFTERENCKIYTYTKVEGNGTSQHKDDRFEWNENTIKTSPELYEIITSFLQTLRKSGKRQIKVGISGLNNTGKTSIILECAKMLSQNFNVRVIPDTFEITPKERNLKKSNKQIIFHQIIDMCTDYAADIIIFDRTPFDNYIYMLMRESEYSLNPKAKVEHLKLEYDYLIENLMNCFDLVYLIQRTNENKKCKTKYVTSKERKTLVNLYSKYIQEYIPVIDKSFEVRGKEFFAEDVKNIAQIMSERIQDYYYL